MTKAPQPLCAPLRVDLENEWVWCGEQPLKLTPKAFAVLRYLIEHPGRLVSKDELLLAVWPDTVVTEGALATCMRWIRKALADDPHAPQYIETVHRRYRFIAPFTMPPLLKVPRSKFHVRYSGLSTRTQHSVWWAERQNLHNFTAGGKILERSAPNCLCLGRSGNR